jgi:hypothetical protein
VHVVAGDASSAPESVGRLTAPCEVSRVTFSGSSLLVALRCCDATVTAEVPNDDSVPDLRIGQSVRLAIRDEHLRVFVG